MCQKLLDLLYPNFLKAFPLVIFLASCSSSPNIPYKGQDLDNLDQAANYITTKNNAVKYKPNGLVFDEKAFSLGAYDFRDDLPSRVPVADFEKLSELVKQKRPKFSNFTTAESNKPNNQLADANEDNLYPEGLNSPEKRLSYLIARNLADVFTKKGIPVIPASMMLGVKDAQNQTTPKLNEVEEKLLLKEIKDKLADNSSEWSANQHAYYKKEEKKFFAMNVTQPGVILLNSGVQYKFLELGKGRKPKTVDKIRIRYKGTLLDGTEFDSSYQRNSAETFPLRKMIAGFIDAMQEIPEGSSAIFYIPSELAYKQRGTAGIPPYAAIIFEIEFLSIDN